MWRTWLRYLTVAVELWWVAGATNITVTGVSTGIDPKTHQRPTRRDIRELFSESGPQWDLYILALSAFQAVDEADELSYFQITGIHGRPFEAWNDVENVPGAPEEMGYCPHGELIFGTWHRPYLALFEQVLVSHAVNISNQYPPNHAPAYKAAAQTLRLPFWDWATDPTVPSFTGDANITVNGPTGPTTIRNPLYSYRFQNPVPSSWGGQLSTYQETSRCMGTDGSVNNMTKSNLSMMTVGFKLKTSVYDAFIRSTRFEDVACTDCGGPNFEDPHSTVHTTVGCGGTMADIVLSAFDPLFMLHHCNVDRLFAMWQAINYKDTMFERTSTSYGQFGTPGGSKITRDSPLKPFRADPLTFHTSDLVTNISTFGYTYPEIYDWDTSPDQSRAFVITQVNMLYGPNSTYDRTKSFPYPQKHPSEASGLVDTQQYYVAQVQLDRAEIPLPAVVGLVINGTTVGSLALLAMPSYGNVSTSVTIQDPRLAGLVDVNIDSKAATSVLQQGLAVEILHNGETEVPVNTVPSLKVELQAIEYTPNTEKSQFPRLGNVTRLPIAIRPVASKFYR
ncbi:Di-copper centre-containing protein [Rhypophila decipiens]|uniref:tyrosinase n=1 Tax=Rhypophila decipiens TaxID=261697 RepID=A0AAN7BDF7_9PEZI|nr:Di-copper centre-containing protein [Rhypophila decipiens]